MKAVRGIYEKGKVKLSEMPLEKGPLEVLVVFPEDDPWKETLEDPTPRPKLNKMAEQVKKEISQGKAKPLRLKDL